MFSIIITVCEILQDICPTAQSQTSCMYLCWVWDCVTAYYVNGCGKAMHLFSHYNIAYAFLGIFPNTKTLTLRLLHDFEETLDKYGTT